MFLSLLAKNKYKVILFTLFVLLLVVLIWPVSAGRKQRAAVLLEGIDYYQLSAGDYRVYFSGIDSVQGLKDLSFDSNACFNSSYEVGYFTSYSGKIVTHEQAFSPVVDTLQAQSCESDIIGRSRDYIHSLQLVLKKQMVELDYYVKTHMHDDDGFEEMVSVLAQSKQKDAMYDSLLVVLDAIQKTGGDWSRKLTLSAYYTPVHERRRYACTSPSFVKGHVTVQLAEKALPQNASCVHNPFFAYDDLTVVSEHNELDTLVAPGAIPHVGILQGKNFLYRGELIGESPNGLGICTFQDGTIMQGHWLNGLLNGEGLLANANSIAYSGTWAYGHLSGGVAKYPDGSRYSGSFLEDSIFDGSGEMDYADGSFYYGSWGEHKHNGFGMFVDAEGKIQCGTWKDDEFEGERLLYTADRVYGIDVARYQHLNRRRRPANIAWKYLRITSLGTKSKKRISGEVSYPVSFAYIKATEGATVVNKYFKSDYKQARAQGIHVGSYHFFSSVPAEQQLAWFFKNNTYQKGDLPPVLDLEPTNAYITKRWGSDAKMFEQVLKWLKGVEARYGVKPLLYVNQNFIKNHLSQAPEELQNYDLWVARYGEFKPYSHMIYWQIAPDGKVSGIQSPEVDINVFNGSKERFEEYVNAF